MHCHGAAQLMKMIYVCQERIDVLSKLAMA